MIFLKEIRSTNYKWRADHRFHDKRDMSPNRLSKAVSAGLGLKLILPETYLGLMRCRAVPRVAIRMKRAADATYAQPRKGFLPPIQETVETTNDLVPLYGMTGKSAVARLARRNELM
jgi:hypothetical protein